MKRLLCAHPSIHPLAERNVLVLDAVAELVSAAEDGPGYLPRVAALAFRQFIRTMTRRLGNRSTAFVTQLENRVVTARLYIEDYGELPLVEPLSRPQWLTELGKCFAAVSVHHHVFACDKHGPNMLAAELAAGLGPAHRLVSVTRHPVAAAVSLSASNVVRMPIEESCALVRMHYERWLACNSYCNEIVVRFEDLLRQPAATLRAVGERLRLPGVDRWSLDAAILVGRVSDPRTECPALAKAAAGKLSDVTAALGYSEVD
jgi:hypothetical protein